MDFEFLEPVQKKGFKKLEVKVAVGKIIHFQLTTTPRKLEALTQGELELRTEIHLTLGSDLITYGLDKFFLILKELTGRGDTQISSTLKYDILRFKPELSSAERLRLEKLYYEKVNAPVKKFIDALGPRVRKVREFIKDADEVVDQEVREVAAKEIVQRLRKTTADFGFDLDRISKRTGDLLGRMADSLGETETRQAESPEYQAIIRKRTSQRDVKTKPQLVIVQQGTTLQIYGGSSLDARFGDITPELLYDTLRRYLLTNIPKGKRHKRIAK